MRLWKKNIGFTLLEVMIASAVLSFASIVGLQIIDSSSKSQKKMSFDDLVNQQYQRINYLIRSTQEGCQNNIEVNYPSTNCPPNDTTCSSLRRCQNDGTNMTNLVDSNNRIIFSTNDDPSNYISGMGVTIRPMTIMRLLPTFDALPNPTFKQGTICVEFGIVGGPKTILGSRRKWLNFPISLFGNNDGSQNNISSCLNNNSSDLTEACNTLNGEIFDLTNCTNINPTDGNINFDINDYTNRVQNAAINALGNLGVGNKLNVCGNIVLSDRSDGSFPSNPKTGCVDGGPATPRGGIYSHTANIDEIAAPKISVITEFETYTIDNSGNKIGPIIKITPEEVYTPNLNVTGTSKITDEIESTKGFDNLGEMKVNITETNALSAPQFSTRKIQKINGELEFLSYLRACNVEKLNDPEQESCEKIEYLITKDWIESHMLTNMGDAELNEFFKTFFQTESDEAGKTIYNYLKDNIKIDETTKYLDFSTIQNTDGTTPIAGEDYCSGNQSIAHIEVDSFQENDENGNPVDVLKLAYYCRSNDLNSSGEKQFFRITGDQLLKFHGINDTTFQVLPDCSSTSELAIGGFCIKPVAICEKSNQTYFASNYLLSEALTFPTMNKEYGVGTSGKTAILPLLETTDDTTSRSANIACVNLIDHRLAGRIFNSFPGIEANDITKCNNDLTLPDVSSLPNCISMQIHGKGQKLTGMYPVLIYQRVK